MKILLSLLLISTVIVLSYSCSSKKTSTNTVKEIEDINAKLTAEGFFSGKLISSAEGSACPYTIDLDDENYSYLLDPINLEDAFKKDGLMIWVKFNSLRMQNRCNNANPVTITEIKIREN